MRVSDYITNFLKEKEINDVFMLTGYGAMYLNDAIKLSGINYYTTRNEATAPIMAQSYARVKNKVIILFIAVLQSGQQFMQVLHFSFSPTPKNFITKSKITKAIKRTIINGKLSIF